MKLLSVDHSIASQGSLSPVKLYVWHDAGHVPVVPGRLKTIDNTTPEQHRLNRSYVDTVKSV